MNKVLKILFALMMLPFAFIGALLLLVIAWSILASLYYFVLNIPTLL